MSHAGSVIFIGVSVDTEAAREKATSLAPSGKHPHEGPQTHKDESGVNWWKLAWFLPLFFMA